MVTLNVINLIGAGVKMDGFTADVWLSLMTLHNAQSDLGLIHVEEELALIKYVDSTSIEAHFKVLWTAWLKANDQDADINDKQFYAYVIKSMLSSWAAITGLLTNEKKSAEVIVQLMTHALLLHGTSAVAPARSAQALVAQAGHNISNAKEKGVCLNSVCSHVGHTIERCFKKGGVMEGKFPEWWRKSWGGRCK
ncbi:hypothetical protein C0993_006137 [Termitomyces sp. T159_Od127]|nr:hypothetical protein C0993_006137 [Termitomyces sp. T159_Od127]